jgi:hypothetical protein
MVQVAFYVGSNSLLDSIVNAATFSRITHCEVVVSGLCYSATARDGFVRSRNINLNRNWILISASTNSEFVIDFYKKTAGMPYDWIGAVLPVFLHGNVCADQKRKWHCAQWCAHAIGLKNPEKFKPKTLFEYLSNSIIRN